MGSRQCLRPWRCNDFALLVVRSQLGARPCSAYSSHRLFTILSEVARISGVALFCHWNASSLAVEAAGLYGPGVASTTKRRAGCLHICHARDAEIARYRAVVSTNSYFSADTSTPEAINWRGAKKWRPPPVAAAIPERVLPGTTAPCPGRATLR